VDQHQAGQPGTGDASRAFETMLVWVFMTQVNGLDAVDLHGARVRVRNGLSLL
jgi:hypothetical protein